MLLFINKIIQNDDNVQEIILFVFNGNEENGDLEITNRFIKELSQLNIEITIVDYTSDTERFVSQFNKCDFILGVRLHSAILAYALKIPFILIEYHPKCTDFLNTIDYHYRFDLNDIDTNFNTYIRLLYYQENTYLFETDLLKHIFINEILELEGFNDLK